MDPLPRLPHPFVSLVVTHMIPAPPFVLNMFGTDYVVLTGKFIESRRGNCYDRIEEKTWKEQMP